MHLSLSLSLAGRYDHGSFYPCDAEAAGPGFVGTGSGRGFTVNVGWNASAMGDAE